MIVDPPVDLSRQERHLVLAAARAALPSRGRARALRWTEEGTNGRRARANVRRRRRTTTSTQRDERSIDSFSDDASDRNVCRRCFVEPGGESEAGQERYIPHGTLRVMFYCDASHEERGRGNVRLVRAFDDATTDGWGEGRRRAMDGDADAMRGICLLYTSPSPRD